MLSSRDAARQHLEALAAAPRPAGGSADAAARQYCAAVLNELGFRVTLHPFDYSAVPGRLATPLAGLLGMAALLASARLGELDRPGASLLLLVAVAIALGVGGDWVARRGVLSLPLLRASAVNLQAVRGDASPALWLVAHLDSKSQPIPILVRALGVIAMIVVWLTAALLAALQLAGWTAAAAIWPLLGAFGIVAALPLVASVVGAKSAGALDNASGVATVLLVASTLPPSRSLGVLLTSAEELGLAGARAWVRGRVPATAINCDGMDDSGPVRLTHGWRGAPEPLSSAFRRAAATVGVPLDLARLVPGVLLDGVALADAGWQVVTVSKGTLATVARIHSSHDTIDRLTGSGCAEAAALVARAAQELP